MHDRRGLATLELVLALPILLCVMALMMNFGTAACWKVRSLVMARKTLWEGRTGRSEGANPQPAWWPAAGSVTADRGKVTSLDDPRVDLPVARGPLPPGAEANSDLLDPTRGLSTSSSELTRTFPLLRNMGTYNLSAQSAILDGKWDFYNTMSAWYFSERRTPFLYAFQKASSHYGEAYVKAVVAIFCAPFRKNLRPLDRDDEFLYYNQLFDWGTEAPDFHPVFNGFCDLDQELAESRVQELIERIEGKIERDKDGNVTRRVSDVAETMTSGFIDLYQRVIEKSEALKKSKPPLPSEEIATLESRIKEMQENIKILKKFQQTLTSR